MVLTVRNSPESSNFSTFDSFLALVAAENFEFHGTNVKAAFLNNEVVEDIIMEPYEDFVVEERPGFVCNLRKALYASKQAPTQWFAKINVVLYNLGFRATYTIFTKIIKCRNSMIIVSLYEAHVLLVGSTLEAIYMLKSNCLDRLEMEACGEVKTGFRRRAVLCPS